MTEPSRQLARAARRLADHNWAGIRAAAAGSIFHATVTTVAAGLARDGNAVVQVTYRGQASTAAGYPSTYTPAVGDRVLCVITVDHQLSILHHSVGAP